MASIKYILLSTIAIAVIATSTVCVCADMLPADTNDRHDHHAMHASGANEGATKCSVSECEGCVSSVFTIPSQIQPEITPPSEEALYAVDLTPIPVASHNQLSSTIQPWPPWLAPPSSRETPISRADQLTH